MCHLRLDGMLPEFLLNYYFCIFSEFVNINHFESKQIVIKIMWRKGRGGVFVHICVGMCVFMFVYLCACKHKPQNHIMFIFDF